MADRRSKFAALAGASTGSVSDLMHQYFRATSGLPVGSVTDHMRAAILNVIGNTAQNRAKDTTTLLKDWYVSLDAGNNTGSIQDRSKRFFG